MSLIKDHKQLTTEGGAAAGNGGRKHGRDALGSRGRLAKATDAPAREQLGPTGNDKKRYPLREDVLCAQSGAA